MGYRFSDFDAQPDDSARWLYEMTEQTSRESIADQERSGYSDRCDIEAALAAGFDPFAGLTIEEWAAANKFDLVSA